MDEIPDTRVDDVSVTDTMLSFLLKDGRTVSVPLDWYPKLLYANVKQRSLWVHCHGGYGVHWPYLDEDLSSEGLLQGSLIVKTSP